MHLPMLAIHDIVLYAVEKHPLAIAMLARFVKLQGHQVYFIQGMMMNPI